MSHNYDIYELIEFWFGNDSAPTTFYKYDGVISSILLSIVTTGLVAAYLVLVYHIRKYFKGQMVLEMCRLTVLFAVFCICYGLRTFY